MSRVIVVGGGISGLVAAYRLQQKASGVEVTLVERATRLGGKILSERLDGFLVEGGPDCFLSRKPGGLELCEELGLLSELQGRRVENRKTYIQYGGQLHRLPEGLTGMVPTKLEALSGSTLISPEGRERLAEERNLPAAPPRGDESVASFIRRRFGDEIYERLIEPLMGGIYAGDASQLSLAATFPQLKRLEQKYGSLIRGLEAAEAQGRRSGEREAEYPPFVALRGGMGALVERLIDQLDNVALRTGEGVQRIQSGESGYLVGLESGERLEADSLVLATPAHVTARIVEPLDDELASLHEGIPYAGTVIVSLAYRKETLAVPLDGFGYVIPNVEGKDILACTWSSSKWEGRAPENHVLIRLYFGRYGGQDVLQFSNEQLLRLSREELAQTIGLAGNPLFHRIYRWPAAMPQYTLGHLERLEAIDRRLDDSPGLFLAGAAYRGVGIPDCIRSGERAAAMALAYLEQDRSAALSEGGV